MHKKTVIMSSREGSDKRTMYFGSGIQEKEEMTRFWKVQTKMIIEENSYKRWIGKARV